VITEAAFFWEVTQSKFVIPYRRYRQNNVPVFAGQ